MVVVSKSRSILWIVKASIIAAVYASIVIVLAPISFYAVQVRVADALLALPILSYFSLPSVVGLTIGCVVANMFSPFGLLDIVFGSIANLLAGLVAWFIGRISRRIDLKTLVSATLLQSITIALVIGYGLLHLVFNEPLIVSITGVFIGSVISICIIGSTIVLFINKRLGIN